MKRTADRHWLTSHMAFAYAIAEMHLSRMRSFYLGLGLALLVVVLGNWYLLGLPPENFPVEEAIPIAQNQSLYAIARDLEERNVVSSAALFSGFARLAGKDDQIQAGIYLFKRPVGLWEVLRRLTVGETGVPLARVRFIEGETARDLSAKIAAAIPGFDSVAFLEKAESLEGYLFPDTYLILYEETPEEILSKLYGTFEDEIETIDEQIRAFDRPLRDVLIMASLLEREARSLEEKRTVAGVLWKRLELGMPLQVDAVFGYIKKTKTYSPSFSDLDIDSPYNTYLYKGLPPGPIANPGLASILAAVTPAETEALYYLTGRDGVMRYARTFKEHTRNRALYLD